MKVLVAVSGEATALSVVRRAAAAAVLARSALLVS
jgi:hypothetical protein